MLRSMGMRRVQTHVISSLRTPQVSRFVGLGPVSPLGSRTFSIPGLGWLQKKSEGDAAASIQPGSPDITTEIGNVGEQVAGAAQAMGEAVGPDQIGYFASVGLAQSWVWPSGIFQHIFEITNVMTGFPWWATILTVTLGTRVLMLPLYLSASDASAKMTRIKPQLTEIMERTKNATEQADIQRAMIDRKRLMTDNNVSILSMTKPVMAMPIFLGVFGALRGMSGVPVHGFTTEGLAWFTNLAAADPYCGLQIITALVYAATFKFFGGEIGASQISPVMKKVFTYMPFVAVPLTMSLPASVCFYFAINGLFSVVQSTLLKSPAVRRTLKLSPMVTPAEQKAIEEQVGQVRKQSDSVVGALRQRFDDAKAQAERKVQEQERAKQAQRDKEMVEASRYVKLGKKSRR